MQSSRRDPQPSLPSKSPAIRFCLWASDLWSTTYFLQLEYFLYLPYFLCLLPSSTASASDTTWHTPTLLCHLRLLPLSVTLLPTLLPLSLTTTRKSFFLLRDYLLSATTPPARYHHLCVCPSAPAFCLKLSVRTWHAFRFYSNDPRILSSATFPSKQIQAVQELDLHFPDLGFWYLQQRVTYHKPEFSIPIVITLFCRHTSSELARASA